MSIRSATIDDLNPIVELSELKRDQYASYSPFWRKAAKGSEIQIPFIAAQLERPHNIALVAEESGKIQGFLIAAIIDAPPVYDPGGKVCVVDDFMVFAPELWPTVGRALLTEARTQAKARGAVLSVVVCGHLDSAKRSMIQATGASIASEWYVDSI